MSNYNPPSSLLDKIKNDFIGLDTVYPLADGRKTKRIYLDSTASTLMMGAAHQVLETFLTHYANSHSNLHFSAKISTQEYQWAHDKMLSFLGADPETYTCFFTGSGTTAGMNRLARIFRDYRKDKSVVLVSIMEHHSNDLPHRKHSEQVIHVPLKIHSSGQPGSLDLDAFESILKEHQDHLNYVAITGISNVTGIINPIYDLAEIAHSYDALVLIDGAQMVAHAPVKLSNHENPLRNIDAFVFSGHKTYVPGSPGVVVCRKEILLAIEPEEVGGGMVDQVMVDNYIIKDYFPDREEAGTPNIPGAIALATAIDVLDRVGMDAIHEDEELLVNLALKTLKEIPEIRVYGETDPTKCQRAGSISFNVTGMHHGLVAAILNDYFNIAVRNECFCAHPYVKELILDEMLEAVEDMDQDDIELDYKLIAGMVRASFGLYTTPDDIFVLGDALKSIVNNKSTYSEHYEIDSSGNYVHKTFNLGPEESFSISKTIDAYLK